MPLAFAHIGDRAGASGGTSFALTLSRALAAGELGLCAVVNSKGSAPDIPTLSGGGVTWVQVATVAITSTTRLTVFRAQGSSPSGTALTIDFAGISQTGCLGIVDAVTGARPDVANNGAAAILQAVTGAIQTVTDYTVTGAALANANNAQWTAFGTSGGQNIPTAQDGSTLLNAVTKGSPANAEGTVYEIGDNHARTVIAAANTICGILLEVSQQAALVLGGTITPSGALAKLFRKPLAGTLTPTGALASQTNRFRSFAGSITPQGSLSIGKLLKKALAGTITPVGTLTRQLYKTYYVAIAGTISPAGTLAARFLGTHYLALSGLITPVGTLVRSVRSFLLSTPVEVDISLTPSSETAATLTPTSDEPAILIPTDEIEG